MASVLSMLRLASALLLLASIPVQAAIICPRDGVCFETVTDGSTSFGFATPLALDQQEPELLVYINSSLTDYGFVAFSSGQTSDEEKFYIALYDFPFATMEPCVLNVSDFSEQVSERLPNNTLVPVGPLQGIQANITSSPLFNVIDTSFSIIFRYQNLNGEMIPSILTENNPIVNLLKSAVAPIYLDNITHPAILPLQGADSVNVTLNTTAMEFSNYTAMLKAAELD